MYPVNLKVEGIPCLVIGGGHIALRKIRKLLKEKALITVLAPEACSEIGDMAVNKDIQWEKRTYTANDWNGYQIVITAAGRRDVAEDIRKESIAHGFLYNAADFPELGNYTIPASFRTGGIQIAVSTDGRSPAMSRYVKKWLENKRPSDFPRWLDRVEAIRLEVRAGIADSKVREEFWHVAFNDQIMDLVLQGNLDEAEECVRHAIGSFGVKS